MFKTLADRVVDVLEQLPLGTHLCHFYQTPQDMLDVLVPYFAAGVRRGEKCLWIVDRAITLDEARQALAEAVPDLDNRVDLGQVEFFTHTQWYVIDGAFDEHRVLQQFLDKERDALAAGYKGLRLTGNTLWARDGHWAELLDYEKHVDHCLCDYQMSAICTYPLARCSAADVVDVAKAHELVLICRDGTWEIIESSAMRQMREELRESHDRLEALAHQMVAIEQRERRRISKVLHDGLQQTIVAAKMSLAQARSRTSESRDGAIDRADQLLAEAMDECRTLTTEISPPILFETGLAGALRWLRSWFDQQHGLTIHLETPEAEPPLSETQRVSLFEVARELLFNVVKHAGIKQATVSLSANQSEIQLEVIDAGVGYEPAVTADGEKRFGLFSIRERLRMMKGQFKTTTAPGQGCHVSISLPLTNDRDSVAAPESQAGRDERPRQPRDVAATVAERKRVLLADDHAILRQGLCRLLADHTAIEVVGEAGDGAEAVTMARELDPDVVLMDVSMPRMNGIEATRQICRSHPHVRVIGLSMHDHDEIAETMVHAGAEAYLQKSGCEGALVATILGETIKVPPAQKAARRTFQVTT